MVRRPTLILLVIFALLIGLVFYLQKNPLPSNASRTPSPTPRAQVVQNLMPGDISQIELKEKGSSESVLLKKDGEQWLLGADGKALADTGKIEQIRAEIAALKVVTEMPEEMDDNALGLREPVYTLALQTTDNKAYAIQIGDKTPIENGYYAQIDDGFAFVVSNIAVDTIVDLMKEIAIPEKTPAP